MSNRKRVTSLTMAGTFLGVCALMFWCVGAFAQQGGRGATPQNPEKLAKVWELEARTVAQGLALSAEQTTKLVDAYKAARESHMAAVRAKMTPGERPDFQALREVNQAEKGKFETALKAFLNPEQTTKALAVLGIFSRRWDPMVEALDGMNLEEKAKGEAMKLVAGYVAESDKLMQGAAAGGDLQSVREQVGKLKEKLDGDLGKVLSADQLTKWKDATARGGGRRGAWGQRPNQPAPAPESKPAAK